MDPISTISGLVDTAAFADGSATATGAAVVAEVAQLLNKTNEVIGGLTVVAADLVDAESDIGAMSTHETRLLVLESAVSTDLVYSSIHSADFNLLIAEIQVLAYRTFNIFGSSPGVDIKLVLPAVTQDMAPITVVAHDLASLRVFAVGSWINGTASNYGTDAGYVLLNDASGNGRCLQFVAVKNLTDSLYYWTPIGPFSLGLITP